MTLHSLFIPFLLIYSSLFNEDRSVNGKVQTVNDEYLVDYYFDVSRNTLFCEHENELFIKTNLTGMEEISPIKIDEHLFYLPFNLNRNNFDEEKFNFCASIISGNLTIYESELISFLSIKNYDLIVFDEYINSSPCRIYACGYYCPNREENAASYLTQRIWLKADNDTNEEFAVAYNENNKIAFKTMNTVTNFAMNENFNYVDIPFDVEQVNFVSGKLDSKFFLVSREFFVSSLTYGVCYNVKPKSQELDYIEISGADANLLSFVLEGYLTYGSNKSNGCIKDTIKNIFFTWFKNKSATTKELRSTKILDYSGYSKNGNSYEGLTKDTSYSVYEKWLTLCENVGINAKTGKDISLVPHIYIFLIISVAIGLSTASVYVVIKLKKRKAKK